MVNEDEFNRLTNISIKGECTMKKQSLQNKMEVLEQEMNQEFKLRVNEIHGLLLAMISKTNLMLLGDPGTGKSAMLERFSRYFPNTNPNTTSIPFFKVQFTGHTKPDSIMGPVDVSIYKNESRLVTKFQNYAPNARIGMFDEFARGGQTTDLLLTLINEKEIMIDGQPYKVPMEMACGATNHDVCGDKEIANQMFAIRDRFLQWFNPLSIPLDDEDDLIALWKHQTSPDVVNIISEDEIAQIRKEASEVILKDSTLKTFIRILRQLRDEMGIHLSDRRTKAMMKIFQAQAWLMGHKEIEDEDLIATIPCAWQNKNDIDKVSTIVTKTIDQQLYRITQIQNRSYTEFESWVQTGKSSANMTNQCIQTMKDFKSELEDMKSDLKPKNETAFNQSMVILNQFITQLSNNLLRQM